MDPMFKLLDEDKYYSNKVNSLIAKAKEGGPTLLAIWHRDRQRALKAGRGGPDTEA
jgi:hypothetical protein